MGQKRYRYTTQSNKYISQRQDLATFQRVNFSNLRKFLMAVAP